MQSTFTGLGRPLVFSYSSNRLVAISTLVAMLASGIAYTLTAGSLALTQLLWFGFSTGMAVFLAWAICRELAPDQPKAALFTIIMASVGLIWRNNPALAELCLLLLVLRILNRTTGLSPTWPDIVALSLLALFICWQGILAVAFMLPIALWLNTQLPGGSNKFLIPAILLLVAFLIVSFWHLPFAQPGALDTSSTIIIITLASGFAFYIRKKTKVNEVDDTDNQPLNFKRVRSAQLVALLFVAVVTLWLGNAGLAKLLPVWAAFGSIFITLALNE